MKNRKLKKYLTTTKPGFHGFTLIEVMIVVAIIAIVAAVALPGYQAQARDSRRADCNAVLAQSRQAMERYYSKSFSYTGAAAGTDTPNKCPEDGNAQYYAVTLAVPAGGTAYTITATPQGDQANDGCGTLTINQAGVKTCSTGGCTIDACW